MKFEEVPVALAVAAVLAHSHRLGAGEILKKGHTLTRADCDALVGSGIERVTVARLDLDDVDENEASRRVAHAVAGPQVSFAPASTGRTNLFASVRGLLIVSRADLDRVNLVDEAITVATAAPFALVESGARVATVKIIPFAVPAGLVTRACDRARDHAPVLAVAPLVRKRVGLVLTVLPGLHEETRARTANNQRRRMEHLGGTVARELDVAHDVQSVASAMESLLGEGLDLVLALGASAIVDRQDIIPKAIEAIGGVVDHLGIPVEPGNLLLLGHRGHVPIVGVPGCARTLRRSGFDWVLERLAADVPVTREDMMRFGAGGLLAEIGEHELR